MKWTCLNLFEHSNRTAPGHERARARLPVPWSLRKGFVSRRRGWVCGVAGFSPGKKNSISPANFCQDLRFYALWLVVAVHVLGNLIGRDFLFWFVVVFVLIRRFLKNFAF